MMIARNSEILWTELDGKVAFLDVEGGQYYEANRLGSVIWGLLEVPRSTADIVDHVVARFRVDPDRCAADVANYLDALRNVGLITGGQPAASGSA